MDILYLLIPLSLVLVFVIGAILWWALDNGQFDDLDGPAHQILLDDDAPVLVTGERAAGPSQSSRHG